MSARLAADFCRDAYGQLRPTTQTGTDVMRAAAVLIEAAVAAKKIPPAYDDLAWDRRSRASGSALHHELYDVAPAGTRALVCIRQTAGSKYGVATVSKNYLIIARCGRGVRVSPAPKFIAARTAKNASALGDAIAALGEGK